MSLDRHLVAATISPLAFESAEWTAFLDSLQRPPRVAIRLRPGLSAENLPFETQQVPWHPQGRFLLNETRPGAFLEFAAADYYIQDAASLLAVALLDPRPGEVLCDLCAAPGGKATAVLEAIGDSGWLLANEAVQSRHGMLEFNLARHGATRYAISALDPHHLAERLPSQFDAVLVDAPCSGQSLFGRGKQTESAFATNTVEHCAARQIRILDAAAQLVRPGGRLVYSTCTFSYAENEGQVESFLQRQSGWNVEEGNSDLRAVCGNSSTPGLRLWPHRHGSGGAYAVRLRRTGEDVPAPRARIREVKLHSASLPAEFREWGELSEMNVWHNNLQCFAWPDGIPEEFLMSAVAGPEVAFRKGNTWFPAYALAMRRDPNWSARQRVELDDQQASQFVRGEVLSGNVGRPTKELASREASASGPRGWSVAVWRGRSLGWLKGDGRQLKNHLPKSGRLTQIIRRQ